MTTDAHDANPSSPQLLWADDGSPRSGRFGDVYFSKDDGLAETRAVFLGGCDMPAVWQGRRHFTVGELGFGTGLNIIALIDLWRAHRPDQGHLHVFTVEGYPLTREEAAKALAAWPDVADTAAALLDQWPDNRPGFHRIDLPQWGVTIDLAIGEVEWALAAWSGKADAWFLDGFSPALNPGMWSEDIMAAVTRLSAPGCHLATFTVAGAVRRALAANGFTVEKRPGHGRKRERLEARLPADPAVQPPSPRSIAVIGGGIAGASVVRALKAIGLLPVLIERSAPGAGASGFPASLVTPRLDAGDAFIGGLYAQCLDRAGQLYNRIDKAILQHGVVQLEQAERDAVRYDKIAAQPLWPDTTMQRLSAAEASDLLGEKVDCGGLYMKGAFALSPATALSAWLADTPIVTAEVTALQAENGQWSVLDRDGQTIATADAVVVAAGWGTAELLPQLNLAPVAGQADWVNDGSHHLPAAWGGYSIPTGHGLLYGATHVRGETDPQPSSDASDHNLQTLQSRLPMRADEAAKHTPQSRVAVRATTSDRLPVCGPVDENLYVLSGMGSRGFCASPLLAEHLAALITGTTSPLPVQWADRLSPARLHARRG
ncbi:FAD-dependent 5-carboxymethylaminomethyl-2-thiouridine(34) oxidoreductase MnmC [uncultured Brevundimonas sp.]|uniref:FAD-dependent 5-carboxymethylaminomethyl-2-thiouridine(34) oxidoreductase MnmC n=1 Tax=uncultured Brevundimonas sp. TaxID=213418 RepID=UPI00260B68D1|nr:FAD-dependent 5-carboxymethylaminomethyl-2-thiouridine(34) oxidoreductase MnmC [uncultured Brevundimonas sp.]